MVLEKNEEEAKYKAEFLENKLLKAKRTSEALQKNIEGSVIVNNKMRNQINELLEILK